MKRKNKDLGVRKIKTYSNDDGVVFTDGSRLTSHHSPDCCEYNYADFEGSISDSILEGMNFDKIVLSRAESGFLLNGHMINCYSEQNGYYSDDVDVYFHDNTTGEDIHYNIRCDGKY